MLYTIIPVELVLEGLEDLSACQEITYNGSLLMVRPIGLQQVQVVQLISSDPADYLNPELQPGRILDRGFALSGDPA